MNGLHKSGNKFPIHLEVNAVEHADGEGTTEVLYSGRIMLPKSNTDDKRHARCTVRDDGKGAAAARASEGEGTHPGARRAQPPGLYNPPPSTTDVVHWCYMSDH